jgi:hypothetical protein
MSRVLQRLRSFCIKLLHLPKPATLPKLSALPLLWQEHYIQDVHFITQPKFHFVILQHNKSDIQFTKGAGSVHHSHECKHSLVSPYSVPLEEELFDLCLQWPLRCCLFLRHDTQHTSIFHATNWSTAWGTVMSHRSKSVRSFNIIILRSETSVAF